LSYLDWGNPQAPEVLCVHGFRGNAHGFDGFARRFRDRFHVRSLDVRGRGDSDWAPDGNYRMPAYVTDLEGVVEALGLRRFTLVGTSMGGRIAMHYAGRHPEALERLVLNDIGPESEAGSDRITAEAGATPDSFATLEDVIAYRAKLSPGTARMSPDEQREIALTHVRQGPDGRWVWKNDPAFLQQRVAGGSESYPELWNVLASLPCPTLLLWGTVSDVLSEGQARRVLATLRHGVLAPVPGSAHAPTLTEPAAVEALESFLATPVAATTPG
jgi:pimeloyl-ACP methyl ester carboxylesterase